MMLRGRVRRTLSLIGRSPKETIHAARSAKHPPTGRPVTAKWFACASVAKTTRPSTRSESNLILQHSVAHESVVHGTSSGTHCIAAAAATVMIGSAAYCADIDPKRSCVHPDLDASTMKEIRDIKSRLSPLLARVRDGRSHTSLRPLVSIDYSPYSNDSFKDDNNSSTGSYLVSFPMHPLANTLSMLVSVLKSMPEKECVRIYRDGDDALSLVFRDNKASFLITEEGVVLYSDCPPSDEDLRTFTAAYEIGTLPSGGLRGNASYIGSLGSSLNDSDAWLDFFKDLQEKNPGISSAYVPGMSGSDQGRKGAIDGTPRSKLEAVKTLRGLGAHVYVPEEGDERIGWDTLAGYEQVREDVEDTVLLALKHPEAYEKIARATRKVYETNRPKAVIFDGPPGTGKTTTARIIASQAGVPMIYIPVESVVSKWYGESAKRLAQVFDSAEEIGSSIIFLDEIDALATKRGDSSTAGGMHEATRRTLSVLLRRLEGYTSKQSSIFVCATNRREDLDPALLSRFDLSVHFGLPEADARSQIFNRYAQHLGEEELCELSDDSVSRGMAGRDIKEVCQAAERKWASKIIRGVESANGDGDKSFAPPLQVYLACAQARMRSIIGGHSNMPDYSDERERSI